MPEGVYVDHALLGDWFLERHVGRAGLYFDRNELDPNHPKQRGTWVISTRILKTVGKQAT